jgi:acetyltransferase-like isoleucine patch superfamily enzyme
MKIGKNSIIRSSVKIFFPENLEIGRNTIIDDDVILICKKKLKIGDHVHIAPKCIIRSHQEVCIKNYVDISSFVDIFSSTSLPDSYVKFNFRKTKKNSTKIFINDKSFIGSHVVILPGAHISKGTWIGPNSVVNFKTKPWTTYMGNPIREINKRNKY